MSVEPPPRPANYSYSREERYEKSVGGGTSDHEKYAAGFAAVAIASAALAVPLVVQPQSTAEFLLGAAALPTNIEQDRLLGLFAGGLLSAGAAAWALKGDAERHELDLNTSENLQLGLIGFAASNLAANLAHVNDLTPNGLAAGAATAAISLAVPAARLLVSGSGRRKLGDRIKGAFDSLGRVFDLSKGGFKLTSALYALLVPATVVGGAAFTASPAASLEGTLGYVLKGADSVFLWRQIGGALLTISPAILLTLKEKADNDELAETQPRILNAGVLLAGVVQLAALGPLAADGGGGRYLPLLLANAVATTAAGLAGLTSSNTAKKL